MSDATTAGEELIRAVVAGDNERASQLLAPDVHFRALAPGSSPEADDRERVLVTLTSWFPPKDVDQLESVTNERVLDRSSVRYRVLWHDDAGTQYVCEQQAYYDTTDGQISWLHLICSEDRPVS